MTKNKNHLSKKHPAKFKKYSIHHIVFITLAGGLVIIVYTVCQKQFPLFLPYAEGAVAGISSKVGERLFGSIFTDD